MKHKIFHCLRFAFGSSLVLTASALCVLSLRVQPAPQVDENHRGSAAFVKHTEELFAAKVGEAAESPMSFADQMYRLNGGDSITASDITGARAAFTAIASAGRGANKNSTASWFALGPTNARYPAFLNRHGSAYDTSGRITALEIDPACNAGKCTVWVAAAGGGVWKTDQGLSGNGNWVNVSDGSFATGAIGALTYDAAHKTLYAGTGEDAAGFDAEAGLGIYKSTDGGKTWNALGGNSSFFLRCIRQIAVDNVNDPTGNTLYVATGRGVRGISSTPGGTVSTEPGAAGVGILKSTDGGATFTLLQASVVSAGTQPGQTFLSSFGSSRGATDVAVDPTHPGVIYASAYNVGVWRSTDNGASWTNIHPCQVTCGAVAGLADADRSEFALATMPDGHTRMYQGEGDSGPPTDAMNHVQGDQFYSRFFVANTVETGSPTFTDKTSTGLVFFTDGGGNIVPHPSSPGYATYDFCTGQCWYDLQVVSPAGNPNMVYLLGSFTYPESHRVSNARAVLLSRDGGETFTDLTDAAVGTDANHDGLHPDQHALVVNPNNPLQFWEGSDGGLMVSDGTLADASGRCDGRITFDPGLNNGNGGLRPLNSAELGRCRQLLSAVPGRYRNLNPGLSTLQFMHLSVNPANPKDVQGGTQDNGTFETSSSTALWPQTIFGDGGLSGFDATDSKFRFHTYFRAQIDVNFNNGQDRGWDWVADTFFIPPGVFESRLFYIPIITDPTVHGTMFAGLTHVWRTKDQGGPQAYLDQHCNEFTGDFTVLCGDWEFLGGPTLTSATLGVRSGGSLEWVSRATTDNSTLWAATTQGRLFISKNADASPASAVTFTRLDTLDASSPNRAISSVSIDRGNPNRAYVSYLSYNSRFGNAGQLPKPGHVFRVDYDPTAGTATWTNLEGIGTTIGDQPVNAVAFDPNTGDLYAATDFGVVKLAGANPANGWTMAASGLPIVTVSSLTINPGERQLLAATHGRSAWQLALP